jgi:hypothetical protein
VHIFGGPAGYPLNLENILIADNGNLKNANYSSLGFTYEHPHYNFASKEAETFLAGSNPFQLSEIEVYNKE